eukprot:gene6413-21468_t
MQAPPAPATPPSIVAPPAPATPPSVPADWLLSAKQNATTPATARAGTILYNLQFVTPPSSPLLLSPSATLSSPLPKARVSYKPDTLPCMLPVGTAKAGTGKGSKTLWIVTETAAGKLVWRKKKSKKKNSTSKRKSVDAVPPAIGETKYKRRKASSASPKTAKATGGDSPSQQPTTLTTRTHGASPTTAAAASAPAATAGAVASVDTDKSDVDDEPEDLVVDATAGAVASVDTDESDVDDEPKDLVVDEICGHRRATRKSPATFLVHWHGYDKKSQYTWETVLPADASGDASGIPIWNFMLTSYCDHHNLSL